MFFKEVIYKFKIQEKIHNDIQLYTANLTYTLLYAQLA